jgi:hypothetical protein
MPEPQQFKTIDKFDMVLGNLKGLPDVTFARETTVNTVLPVVGAAQTFVIQTARQREVGDTLFVVYVDGERSVRLVLPPKVTEAISRQRDALTTKVRKKVGRDTAAARKAQGIQPAFLNGKRKAGKRAKQS